MPRLDQLLVERGLCESREKAKRLVLAGQVRVNGQPARKPSDGLKPADQITVDAPEKFVSRGGHKLEHALNHFQLNVAGLTAIDLGASTGGFTDCLLQRGAKKVFAVDVGQGQLAWKLRQDPRVVVMEKTNARYLKCADFAPQSARPEPASQRQAEVVTPAPESAAAGVSLPAKPARPPHADALIGTRNPAIGAPGTAPASRPTGTSNEPGQHTALRFRESGGNPAAQCSSASPQREPPEPPADFVVVDCSFISLKKILPSALPLLRPGGRIVALIKPQFEAGKAEADKGRGVITDAAVHGRVLAELQQFVTAQAGVCWRAVVESPLLGPAGNKEFLALIEKDG